MSQIQIPIIKISIISNNKDFDKHEPQGELDLEAIEDYLKDVEH